MCHTFRFSQSFYVFLMFEILILQSKYKLKPFQGAKICFVGFPAEEKTHMEEVLVENGGVVADAAESTHIVSYLFLVLMWWLIESKFFISLCWVVATVTFHKSGRFYGLTTLVLGSANFIEPSIGFSNIYLEVSRPPPLSSKLYINGFICICACYLKDELR